MKSSQTSFIDCLLYSEYSDRQVGYQEIILWSFLMKHIVFLWSQIALYLNVSWSPYNSCCPDHKGDFLWEIMNGTLWTHPVRNRNQIPNSNVVLFNFFNHRRYTFYINIYYIYVCVWVWVYEYMLKCVHISVYTYISSYCIYVCCCCC